MSIHQYDRIKKEMKIAFITNFYPPYPPIIGGIQIMVQMLAEHLVRNNHNVVVIASRPGHSSYYEIRNGVTIYRINGFFQSLPFLYKNAEIRYQPPVKDWLLMVKLTNIFKKERPDIIHIHSRALYSALPLATKFHIPVVVTLHDFGFLCPKVTLIEGGQICGRVFTRHCIVCGKESYNLLKSFFAYLGVKSGAAILKSVAGIMAVSSFTKYAYISNLGWPDEKIAVIPNFYREFSSGEAIRSKCELPQDFILFVGALVPEKGLDILIEAFGRITTKTKLVVMGRKHPDYHYQSTQNCLVLENVPREAILEAYPKCRFLVMPSVWPEPFGIVNLEAMSHKKAVIASKIGGINDIIIDGETGILVPPNDPEALANAIRYLLENPGVADHMGQKGYERWMQTFTPEVVVPQIEKLYQSLISFP
jgi:glycosyltransferase involved in cell wall biosynthesis